MYIIILQSYLWPPIVSCAFCVGLGNTTGTPQPHFQRQRGGRGPTPKSVVFTSLASIPKGNWPSNMCGRAQKKMLSYQMGLSYTIGCKLTNTGPCWKDQGSKGAMKVLNSYGKDYGPHGSAAPMGSCSFAHHYSEIFHALSLMEEKWYCVCLAE